MGRVRTGLDELVRLRFAPLRGRRFGLLIHAASIAGDGTFILELLSREGIVPHRIFTPEHGLFGEAQDQVAVEETKDPVWGLPLRSLYGSTPESLRPSPRDLEDLDLVVVDLQDVGVRYYTFVYTMAFLIQEAARVGVKVLILDRPNPLGGERVEGGGVEPKLRSFVGAFSIPVLHGMTPGELALMWNETEGWKADLEVVPLSGWSRSMLFEHTGLPWVPPSPNMPFPSTARAYGATCLLEGTNVSEGRGTTRPFEMFGAPWVDPLRLSRDVLIPGAHLRPIAYIPTFHKYREQLVKGAFLHVKDPHAFSPLFAGYTLLAHLVQYPDFAWRTTRYEFQDDVPAIDLLLGASWIRPLLEKGKVEEVWARLEGERVRFLTQRSPFLLYV